MDVQELSDRAEIAEVIVHYTRAVDQQRWDEFDDIFTPDAHIDYSAFGGSTGDLAATKEFLAKAMVTFDKTQHMLGLPEVTIDGDRAQAVTPCHNPMRIGWGREATVMVCSLWYHNELVRTPGGWRITRLREERNFMIMEPGGDLVPPGSD
jgi:hypothetical protein